MRYRTAEQEHVPLEEMLETEAREHDVDYSGKGAFGQRGLKIDKDLVWRLHDQVYRRGAYLRGYRKRRVFELLEFETIAGKSVLDVGCGNGANAVFVAMHGAQVSGFDLSPVGVQTAQKMAEANGVGELCHFEVAQASKMPYADDSFDAVMLNAVLHHLVKYPNVREEVFRVLRPGGKMIIADGLRQDPLYRLARGTFRLFVGTSGLGDVDLDTGDLKEFAKPFVDLHIESFCLVEGVKALIGRNYGSPAPIRGALWMACQTDRALLRAFPSLDRYCSEFVLVATKPRRD